VTYRCTQGSPVDAENRRNFLLFPPHNTLNIKRKPSETGNDVIWCYCRLKWSISIRYHSASFNSEYASNLSALQLEGHISRKASLGWKHKYLLSSSNLSIQLISVCYVGSSFFWQCFETPPAPEVTSKCLCRPWLDDTIKQSITNSFDNKTRVFIHECVYWWPTNLMSVMDENKKNM